VRKSAALAGRTRALALTVASTAPAVFDETAEGPFPSSRMRIPWTPARSSRLLADEGTGLALASRE